MTKITDREIELAREVERLRERIKWAQHLYRSGGCDVDAAFDEALREPEHQHTLTPDQLKMWREEYRERAVVRVLLDEAERARDEVAMLRKENAELANVCAQNETLAHAYDQYCAKLAKAREALKAMPHDEACRSSECRRCRILREISE